MWGDWQQDSEWIQNYEKQLTDSQIYLSKKIDFRLLKNNGVGI